MSSKLQAGITQQSRHNVYKQNNILIKQFAKTVAHWAYLPCKALISKEMRRTESVHKLHSMLDKNYLLHEDLESSRQTPLQVVGLHFWLDCPQFPQNE
jgi:hypothetical protein